MFTCFKYLPLEKAISLLFLSFSFFYSNICKIVEKVDNRHMYITANDCKHTMHVY